ncbi:hypothetical protein [Methylobacter tundripaludum]|uniref:hypothetical protein n=1 Tax=Methylobacter tundripaludum TaxID=173365 RepID=UPI0004DFCBCE|nr:hypothetical protein [Methylobacter tundripaludum]
MLRKLSIHGKISALYFLHSLPIIWILSTGDFDAALRNRMIIFTCTLSAIIVMAPLILKYSFFRQSFNWIDALTIDQRRVIGLILDGQSRKDHQVFTKGSNKKLIDPYAINTSIFSLIFLLAGSFPGLNYVISVMCGALGIYLFFVLILITITHIAVHRLSK